MKSTELLAAEKVLHTITQLREARWLVGCLAVFVLGCMMIYLTPHLPDLDHLQKTTLKWAGVVAMLASVMLAIFGSIVAIRNHHATAMSAE